MSLLGWIFLIASWSAITALTLFCLKKTLENHNKVVISNTNNNKNREKENNNKVQKDINNNITS